MNETIAAGKTLILPRCAAEHAIDLCVVRSMDDLEAGAYGILEPKKSCALVTAADIDFAVVPWRRLLRPPAAAAPLPDGAHLPRTAPLARGAGRGA